MTLILVGLLVALVLATMGAILGTIHELRNGFGWNIGVLSDDELRWKTCPKCDGVGKQFLLRVDGEMVWTILPEVYRLQPRYLANWRPCIKCHGLGHFWVPVNGELDDKPFQFPSKPWWQWW